MRRRQLIEIHEQPWCPAGVREGATDYLKVVADVGRQYVNVAPPLNHALQATGATQIIDLCSGGGGPWHTLHRRLTRVDGAPVTVLLTDLFPSANAAQRHHAHGPVRHLATPVDATAVPPELTGFRTLFTAFHHFPPPVAAAILRDAVQQRQGIAVFEQTHRSVGAIALMLVLPLIALLVAPFVRPFRWSRLFWTYLAPVLPLVLCVDGIVSCLRTYSTDELRAMADEVDPTQSYVWEIGRVRSPLSPIGITYAIGRPRPASSAQTVEPAPARVAPEPASNR